MPPPSQDRLLNPAPIRTAPYATLLRQELLSRAREYAAILPPDHPWELSRGANPAVIFSPTPDNTAHGNFHPASWRRIVTRPEWLHRLDKIHTSRKQASRETDRPWRELDAAASSDALLLNLFCYPRVLRPPLLTLLGVEPTPGLVPEFGVRAHVPLRRGLFDATETDMRFGNVLVEAKLTEPVPGSAPAARLARYVGFEAVFDRALLPTTNCGAYLHEQFLRGILAAHAQSESQPRGFCLLCDTRRPDLIDAWAAVVGAVQIPDLRRRLRVVTWQEVAALCPKPLAEFLERKYGIHAPAPKSSGR